MTLYTAVMVKGGNGDDYLLGGAGKNTFKYDSIADGNDEIYSFQVGTGADVDVLDLAALLSYDPNNSNHDINDFITLTDNGINTFVNIDADGNASGIDVSIKLLGVTGVDLNTMMNDGNIVLF
jgi:hypothetical protein